MLKRLIAIIIILTIPLTQTYAKTPAPNIAREQSMQPFNIEEFNKNKGYGNNWIETDKEGNYLRRADMGGTYIEEWSPANSPYLYRTTYDTQGVVISKLTSFYDIDIDYKEFDKAGKITKTENDNGLYKFTIEQLKKKLKQEYHLDIMDTKQIYSINRNTYSFSNQQIPMYKVVSYVKKGQLNGLNHFFIDADTGKTLFTGKSTPLNRNLPRPEEQFEQLLETNQITR